MRSGLFNRMTTRFLILLVTGLLLIIIGGQVYRYLNDRHDTQEAVLCTINEDIPFEGVIIRDEKEINYSGSGVISYTYPDGSKVSVGDTVARVFSDDAEASAETRLKKLNEQIDLLQRAQSPGTTDYVQPESINKKIDEHYKQMIACANKGDYEAFAQEKSNLSLVLNIYNIISGISKNYDPRIAELERQAEQQRQLDSRVKDILTANETGYFVSYCDGYESRLTKSKALSMSQKDIEEVITDSDQVKQTVPSSAIGKMFSDYSCLIVGVIDSDQRVAQDVSLKLTLDSSDKIYDVKVLSVRPGDTEDKSVVVLSCESIDEYLVMQRIQSMQLIFDEYSGLMVPRSAIRFQGEQKGVYVILGENITFKKIDVVYNGGDYVLSSNTAEEDHLLLYDQILLEVVTEQDVQTGSDEGPPKVSADSGEPEGDQ